MISNNHPKRWLIFIITALLLLLMNIDATGVNLALAKISHELQLNIISAQWLISAYFIGGAAVVMLGGRLGDVYGHKNIFIIGAAIFTATSLLIGITHQIDVLIILRLIQGFGAALAWPLVIVINREIFPANRQAFIMGLTAAVMGSAMAIGPPISGVILHYASWRWIFFINVPLGVLVILLSFLLIPKLLNKKSNEQIHYPSASLLVIGLLCVMYALTETQQHNISLFLIICLFVVGVILLAFFVYLQSVIKHPILPLHLLKNKLLRNGIITRALVQANWTAILLIYSLFLQNISNYSAFKTAMVFLTLTATFSIISPIGGRLCLRFTAQKTLLYGLFIMGISFIGFIFVIASTPSWYIILSFILLGIGTGIGFPALLHHCMNQATETTKGIVSGCIYAALFIGGAIGAIYTGSLLNTLAHKRLLQALGQSNLILNNLQQRAAIAAATGVKSVTAYSGILKQHIIESFFHGYRFVILVAIVLVIIQILLILKSKSR